MRRRVAGRAVVAVAVAVGAAGAGLWFWDTRAAREVLVGTARRFALVVGANRGLPGEPVLQYAEADARRVAGVLRGLGGVAGEDLVELVGAPAAQLPAALDDLRARLQAAGFGRSDQLIIYVSSHGSGGELHLDGRSVPLESLRQLAADLPAGLALVVLDACSAGAAIRFKGSEPVRGVSLRTEPEAEGHIIITSTGSDEAAQESQRLGGSVFTSFFVAGLWGAADANGDGFVDVVEAYDFARQARCPRPRWGPARSRPHGYSVTSWAPRRAFPSRPLPGAAHSSRWTDRKWRGSPSRTPAPARRCGECRRGRDH